LRAAELFRAEIARGSLDPEEGVESRDKMCAEPLFPWQNFGMLG
jgi:hypothetical protein